MRSLRMKLVLIMVLLIIALMTVVGAFLINGVNRFYIDEVFYSQMLKTFSQEYISELIKAAGEAGDVPEVGEAAALDDSAAESVPALLKRMLMSQSELAVSPGVRDVYILDGSGGYLDGSSPAEGLSPELSVNLLAALNGEVGQEKSTIVSPYMDIALPLNSDSDTYIVYIVDYKQTLNDLSSRLLVIILQALAFGLVICVVLSFLLAEILINPIEKLTSGVKRLGDGDFSSKLSVPSRDEIGVLTVNFNSMAQVLKSTLEEIANERDKLSTLFLHMTDGVIAFSRSGDIIHINPAAETMLGTGIDRATYQSFFGGIAPIEELLSLKKPQFIESHMKADELELELFLAPFSSEGSGGVMAVIHDITDQIKAEEVRREFVANVSHELRTPLTNIKSYAETIVETKDWLPAATREEFLSIILRETDRMTRIVQDLLTLSRFDYGKMDLDFSRFPIATALKAVYQAEVLYAKNSGHTLDLELEDGLPEIWADRTRIEQVLINIISNSIKYTPAGGRITVSCSAGDGSVSIKISDNGAGIPKSDMPRLFERFYRVDKARSRESGGTGLGLPIAKEIILQHQGEISVESTEGLGTTVTIVLPVD